MGDVEVGGDRRIGAGTLLLDELVDVGIADLDLGLDLAVAQAGECQLIAQVASELLLRHAFGRHPAAQLGDADLVLPRHGLLGLVDRQVVHLDAVFLAELELGPFVDEPLEHDAGQFGPGHALGFGAFAQQALHAGLHFGIGHRLGVDQGDDVLGRSPGRYRGRSRLGRQRGRPQPLVAAHDVGDALGAAPWRSGSRGRPG